MVSDSFIRARLNLMVLSLNPCSNGIWSLTSVRATLLGRYYGLNPCSNGIWSLTLRRSTLTGRSVCLNPCSNGIWSLTRASPAHGAAHEVLILVLMEYGL